ncbi:MAG: 2-hydroxyacid dehydrogenase [Acidipropionibacterium sp.]|nr:2-hydroxyacid dehydrogenase [Acidipropionibacterium sp.]
MGFPELAEAAEIRTWHHESVEALQRDNLLVEQGGPDAIPTPAGLFDGVEEFDAVVTQFCPVPASVIERGERLRAIGVLRGGAENVDAGAAAARGVSVVNTPGRNAEAVAEFTLGMILTEIRNIARSQENLHQGSWDRDFPNGAEIPEIEGKTVGIVGLGQIGRKVAAFVEVMGAHVAFYDPWVSESGRWTRYQDVAELAEVADILCVHARLTPETHHLVSADVLAAMKPTAVLVNTARSGLVDEQALVGALREGRIMGAAIDTFDVEPLPADHPFVTLPNATITGHLAGSTADAFKKTPRLLAPRLIDALRGVSSS